MSNLFSLASIANVLCFLVVLLWYSTSRRRAKPVKPKTCTIVVLGDIGRSPRMMYHAESLLRHGWRIRIIGHGNTPLLASLQVPEVTAVYLSSLPSALSKLSGAFFLFIAPLKVVWQASSLCYALLSADTTQYTLVQNPPALPTLPVAQLCCLITRSKLLIDWHNTGSSVLALRLGSSHPLVRIAAWLEGFFGRYAHGHLFVTATMKDRLSFHWNLSGNRKVFYDRPPSTFRRLSSVEREQFFARRPHLRSPPSWRLAVSSTSWTADEDFSILLDALSAYNRSASTGLLVIITGKGPLKAYYEQEVIQRSRTEQWDKVQVRMAWLAMEDYPLLLGAADLGISLHTSTSGFDLPMKVVDMFGCALPVLALNFPALDELVKDGINGYTFENYKDLADRLLSLCQDEEQLDRLRQGIASASYGAEGAAWSDWTKEWDRVVLPLMQ